MDLCDGDPVDIRFITRIVCHISAVISASRGPVQTKGVGGGA